MWKIKYYLGEDTRVSASHTARPQPNQEGFNRPSAPVQPLTEAPQLIKMTLASSLLPTVVNTSGPFWRMSDLVIISLRGPTFSTYNVYQLQKQQISHQSTSQSV
jgi:hypothetical protein